MRRLLAIALITVLGLPLFASALGHAQSPQLMACCRRGGAHHCMDMSAAASTDQPIAHSVCPAFPHRAASMLTGVWSFHQAIRTSAQLSVQPADVGQVEAGFRIAMGRARQKRGPPSKNS